MPASKRWNELKKQPQHYSGQKKQTPPAQLIINQHRWQIISDRRSANTFSRGSKPDFQLFKDVQTAISRQISCLADSGYQGWANLPAKSRRPKKKSKHRPLSRPEKVTYQLFRRRADSDWACDWPTKGLCYSVPALWQAMTRFVTRF